MKKITKTLCLLLAFALFALPMLGCEKEPGLYAWYGGKMDVENVLTIRVNGNGEEKVYDVSFDTYRTVYVYLKGIVSDVIYDEEGNATALSTDAEKSAAVKEVTEDNLMEYYSLVALCEDYGITITEEDKQSYYDEYQKKIQNYVDQIEESELEYDGTKEEYARELYEKTLAIVNMTPEYFEFTYYRNLLEKRLKMALAADLDEYLAQTYYHYKQVMIPYTKGDAVAEEAARLAVNEAREKLLAGADIDDVIKEYGDTSNYTEIYFDAYGNIVGSSSGDAVNAITVNAIVALDENEISNIISGDSDDYTGYFAVYQRLGFDEEYICGDGALANSIYNYPYVNAQYMTPHYSRYVLLTESYLQNTSSTPVDDKVYNRIAVNTLY